MPKEPPQPEGVAPVPRNSMSEDARPASSSNVPGALKKKSPGDPLFAEALGEGGGKSTGTSLLPRSRARTVHALDLSLLFFLPFELVGKPAALPP